MKLVRLKERFWVFVAASVVVGFALTSASCRASDKGERTSGLPSDGHGLEVDMEKHASPNREEAVFGGGCFWCTEAVFENLRGVHEVVSGYSGGASASPSYDEVVSGETGHIEVIKITFDPNLIDYKDLLFVFFASHDPTTKDRQGYDVGSQYRSVVFVANSKQKQAVLEVIEAEQQHHKNPIVTEVRDQMPFYQAENYHQNYYELNPNKPYCKQIIEPKLRKIKTLFKDKIKP